MYCPLAIKVRQSSAFHIPAPLSMTRKWLEVSSQSVDRLLREMFFLIKPRSASPFSRSENMAEYSISITPVCGIRIASTSCSLDM